MFRTLIHGFFPYFSRAYNMVRVIVGKYCIEIRDLKAGSVGLTKITSNYREVELPRVPVQ